MKRTGSKPTMILALLTTKFGPTPYTQPTPKFDPCHPGTRAPTAPTAPTLPTLTLLFGRLSKKFIENQDFLIHFSIVERIIVKQKKQKNFAFIFGTKSEWIERYTD